MDLLLDPKTLLGMAFGLRVLKGAVHGPFGVNINMDITERGRGVTEHLFQVGARLTWSLLRSPYLSLLTESPAPRSRAIFRMEMGFYREYVIVLTKVLR